MQTPKLVMIIFTFVCFTGTYAQVGIGTASPDASAVLDLTHTSKGLLVPRMTANQRNAILNPAIGLMVYQTNGTIGAYHYDGAHWKNLTNGSIPDSNGFSASSSYGLVSTFAGNDSKGSVDAPGIAANFNFPIAVVFDKNGNLYVTDGQGNQVRKITPAGVVSTFAGSGAAGSTDGPANTASFNDPTGITIDAGDNLYVSEVLNNKIRKITPAGIVSTYAGSGAQGAVDGPAATASFNQPGGMAVDLAGNLYVADVLNNKIRKITPPGTVSTFAGTGVAGSAEGPALAASFNFPADLVFDKSGNLYVVDKGNYKIRKISTALSVSDFAGNGNSGNLDGTGTTAEFLVPSGICTDNSGNLYITDELIIRKITASAEVSTLAGNSSLPGKADGIGTAATFFIPLGIAADGNGNLFVADSHTNRIRKIITQ